MGHESKLDKLAKCVFMLESQPVNEEEFICLRCER
jgi:hypothetical protein